MDEDDEVVREIDVFLSPHQHLQLLQFPLVPVYSDPMHIKSAKFKPKHKQLELKIPYPGSDPFEDDNIIYSSSRVAQDVILASGIIDNNALYLSAIPNVLQLRSSVKDLQNAKGPREVIEDDDDEDGDGEWKEGGGEGGDGLQQVQLKRKESERAQASREQSYTFLIKQQEMESWTVLAVKDIESSESEQNFAKMKCT